VPREKKKKHDEKKKKKKKKKIVKGVPMATSSVAAFGGIIQLFL
jgi:hypothetical protein